MSDQSTPTTSTNYPNDPTLSAPVLDEARDRCASALDRAFRLDDPVLVDALPAMGKSYGVIKWAKETGNPLTVLTARHELYDQYVEFCEEHGLTYKILPSFHRDCETANRSSSDEWQSRVSDKYKRVRSGKQIHTRAQDLFGEDPPCMDEGECHYLSARDFDPDEFDVLIGHYKHAYVPARIEGRYVVLDEFPSEDFLNTYSAGTVKPAVSRFLDSAEDLPFTYPKDILRCRDDAKIEDGIEWFATSKNLGRLPLDDLLDDPSGQVHPHGDAMCYAYLAATRLENGWERAELPDGRTAVQNPETEALTILDPPDFDPAASVVALDGTPTVEKWRLILGDRMEHDPVLGEADRRKYLTDGLNLTIIQTADDLKPYASGKWVNESKDTLLFAEIADREGKSPALISSQQAITAYKENGGLDPIAEPDYYGDFIGTNGLGCFDVGIVAGSNERGNIPIQQWSALAGESVEMNDEKGMERSYGEFGDQFLHGMREQQVLQAIMRFSRGEQGTTGATVYVHTAAIPEWVPVTTDIPSIRMSDGGDVNGRAEVLAALEDCDEWKTGTIASHPRVTVSQRQVRRILKALESEGCIESEKADSGNGYVWSDICVDQANPRGSVQFGQ